MSFGPGDDLPPTGRLLAVDPGSVRLGIAVSDPGRIVATPTSVVAVEDEDDVDAIAVDVAEVVEEHGAVAVVVGWPRDLRGRETAAATRARRLSDAIRAQTGLPVVLWDERLSTVEAERVMLDQDASRATRRRQVDTVAAAIILRGVLDSLRLRG